MTLDDFVRNWGELENVAKLVHTMSNRRDNPPIFAQSYNEFRNAVGAPFNTHLFPQYVDFDDETMAGILIHASPFHTGLEQYVADTTRADFPNILDGIRTNLGDKNLVDYVASLEPKVAAPAGFVGSIRSYHDVLKPLSKDNPQPAAIKTKLVQEIDRVVGANPDAKTTTIANAIKGIYDSERVAASAYLTIFVTPARDAVRQAIDANPNDWKTYMRDNLDAHSREERLGFYADMYKRFK